MLRDMSNTVRALGIVILILFGVIVWLIFLLVEPDPCDTVAKLSVRSQTQKLSLEEQTRFLSSGLKCENL